MGKILFIRGGAVGDFILTLPAIRLIRENLPSARVEVLGYTPITRLAEAARLVDASRSIEYGPLSAFFVPSGPLPDELVDYFRSFSVVVSYLYDPDDYFTENLRRAGVSTLIRGPHRVDESPDLQKSAAVQLAKPLETLALFLEEPHVHLEFDEVSVAAADAALRESLDPAIRWVAIHPGSGSPRKNWSFEGWIETAVRLHASDPSIRFLISSGEAEDRVIAEFLTLLGRQDLPFAHVAHLPLPVLGALLSRCSLYLGHDSGISHLAAASGAPCVLLFGRTDPAIWAPQNPHVTVIRAPGGDLSRIDANDVVDAAIPGLLPSLDRRKEFWT
jgi:heptosyltransferase-3